MHKINKEKINKEGRKNETKSKYDFKDRLREQLKEATKKVTLEYVFTFGKYQGDTVTDVCIVDPAYIRWCMQKKLLDFEKEVIDYMFKREREVKREQEKQQEKLV